jgi:hypothetical protein
MPPMQLLFSLPLDRDGETRLSAVKQPGERKVRRAVEAAFTVRSFWLVPVAVEAAGQQSA